MIDELRARYLPRFLDGARLRVSRGRQHLEAMSLGAVASELHTLAGDAAMLELRAVADAARAGEIAARSFSKTADHSLLAACASSFERVVRELDRLVAPIENPTCGHE
jgi:HPt (histidine-containing phosphotransfer) domain-containing protein